MTKTKFSFGKIAGLSVLVIAMAVGVALTQQNQDFREKAFDPKPMPVITISPSPKATIKPKVKNLNPVGTPVRDY